MEDKVSLACLFLLCVLLSSSDTESLKATSDVHTEGLETRILKVGHYIHASCQARLKKKDQKPVADNMAKV